MQVRGTDHNPDISLGQHPKTSQVRHTCAVYVIPVTQYEVTDAPDDSSD